MHTDTIPDQVPQGLSSVSPIGAGQRTMSIGGLDGLSTHSARCRDSESPRLQHRHQIRCVGHHSGVMQLDNALLWTVLGLSSRRHRKAPFP